MSANQKIREIANIQGLGHIEFCVRDLERARDFYVDLIGLHETERDADRVYLRCTESREHHAFVLRKADAAGVGHISFKVSSPDDLERMQKRFEALQLPTRWVEGEELGQGRALRVRDPLGFTIEYYAEMEPVEWLVQKYDQHRGVAPTRIDHVNMLTPDAQYGYQWYTDELGFGCAELTESDPPDHRIWASWLFRKATVHDAAVMTGKGPSVHHVGFSLPDPISIIKACDIIASAGYTDSLERGPARHGISNALFLYVRDPDGNRFELYTGDYLTGDTSIEPIRWNLNNPIRQTLWGSPPPRRWFEESMAMATLDGNGVEPVSEPQMQAIPDYVLD
ncbi:MAG: 3,4-dihydroxyphenylacetate 2,3-dioxygenase [Nitratireductor sp.]|nr:3,4-dihydroxyphenylacetate 2,3-dioxygenase [Nitratireductor sp.]